MKSLLQVSQVRIYEACILNAGFIILTMYFTIITAKQLIYRLMNNRFSLNSYLISLDSYLAVHPTTSLFWFTLTTHSVIFIMAGSCFL